MRPSDHSAFQPAHSAMRQSDYASRADLIRRRVSELRTDWLGARHASLTGLNWLVSGISVRLALRVTHLVLCWYRTWPVSLRLLDCTCWLGLLRELFLSAPLTYAICCRLFFSLLTPVSLSAESLAPNWKTTGWVMLIGRLEVLLLPRGNRNLRLSKRSIPRTGIPNRRCNTSLSQWRQLVNFTS